MVRVASIFSFHRGTGKSTLIANVAALVATRGYSIGLIDTDIQAPTAHLLTRLKEDEVTNTFNHLLLNECRIEQAAYDLTARWEKVRPGKLFLVPSSMKFSDTMRVLRRPDDVPVEKIEQSIQGLAQNPGLDLVAIDAEAGINDMNLSLMAVSDTIFIILRNDRQDYQGTAVMVDVARRLNLPRVFLIVNHFLPNYDMAQVCAEAETKYAVPVAAVVPHSDTLMAAGSSGLFVFEHPEDPLNAVFRQLADTIVNK